MNKYKWENAVSEAPFLKVPHKPDVPCKPVLTDFYGDEFILGLLHVATPCNIRREGLALSSFS